MQLHNRIKTGLAISGVAGVVGGFLYETSLSKVDPLRVPADAVRVASARHHSIAFLVARGEIDYIDCGKIDDHWSIDRNNRKDIVGMEAGKVIVQCELSGEFNPNTPIQRLPIEAAPPQ